MSMIGGSVSIAQTINPDGTFEEVETKSGLAGAMYDALKAANLDSYNTTMADMDTAIAAPRSHLSEDTNPKLSEVRAQLRQSKAETSLGIKRGWAKQANELGPPIVAYLQANAVVSLASVKATVSDAASVGRLPATLTPGDPIDPPSAAVDLPVTGNAGAVELSLL